MKPVRPFEFPEELMPTFRRAKRVEWISIAYLVVTVIIMYFTLGNSQAMKTAWFEDLLSLTPSISFLIASRLCTKKPNPEFPYGYHRGITIAYLVSAVALLSVGAFLLFEAIKTLLEQDRPTIGLLVIFGKPIWLGYVMMAALLWGTIPSIFLGRIKLPLANDLHDKVLYTDAEMNKADWMTGLAAILGILGIGIGWWWADAAAAGLISLDIVHDGYRNLRQAVLELMNQVPKTVNKQETDPVIQKIKNLLAREPWVKDFQIRLREDGHIYMGEGFVVPVSEEDLVQRIARTAVAIEELHWRIHEFILTPVAELDGEEGNLTGKK